MRKRLRSGFSLLEILSAAVLLAALSVATVAAVIPIRDRAQRKSDSEQLTRLNRIVETYYAENDRWPDCQLRALITDGYLPPNRDGYAYVRTPLGSHYLLDSRTKRVYNPIVRREQQSSLTMPLASQ